MSLVEQFGPLASSLPEGWQSARLRLIVAEERDSARAAALLGPTNPGHRGRVINFTTARRGAGVGPDRIRELLRRLDSEGIQGELELVGVEEVAALADSGRPSLAGAWDAEVARLPPDWSDLYCEVRLTSTDYLERAALLMAPLNPARYGGETGFRFRAARSFGYGASAEMTRRCLERLDEEGIRGSFRLLRALADTYPNATQGPVWYVGGRSV